MTRESSNSYIQSLQNKPRIQITLASLFFILMVITCGSIITINSYTVKQAYTEDALEDLAVTNELVKHEVESFFSPVEVILEHSNNYLKKHARKDNIEEAARFYIEFLSGFPHFQTAGYAKSSGDAFLVGHILEGTKPEYHAKLHKLDNAVYFAVSYKKQDGKETICKKLLLDNFGNSLMEIPLDEYATFHPTKRPWFLLAEDTGSIAWTNVYEYVSNVPGITASSPVYDKNNNLDGVSFLDVTLDNLGAFFTKIPLGHHSVIGIVDDAGAVVLAKESQKNEAFFTQTIGASASKTLEAAHNYLDPNKVKQGTKAHINKIPILVSFHSLEDLLKKTWKVGVMVPESDYVGHIAQANHTIMWVSVLIVIIATAIVVLFSKAISKPINALSQDMMEIQDFRINEARFVPSWIYEISVMSNALVSMKHGLKAFGSYVPKGLVRKLIREQKGISLGGVKRPLTLLFTDIYDFTRLSETLPIDQLFPQLSEYLELLTDELDKSQGTIDKFIGDGIMCFWNAPSNLKDHTNIACEAVLQCKARLEKANAKWQAQGHPPFFTRFALNYGETLVGNVGSHVRMNYTALGDSVNTCARLESLNKAYKTEILTSESVYQRTKAKFVYRLIDYVALKGKTQGSYIYELLGHQNASDSFPASSTDKEVARLSELGFAAYLQREWEEAAKHYTAIIELLPKDLAAATLLNRIKAFKETPPPDDWEGLTLLEHK